ncbi:MAG: class I SAM-dependent methyltransferase [Betaproteobacteria bacterium]
MPVIDKTGVLARLAAQPRVELELGCGERKRSPGAIGIDLRDLPGVDLVGDVFDALAAFAPASVDAVASHHFFEHVDDLPRLMRDVARVVRPGGELVVAVPHFSNPWYYSDPTHRRHFGLYTFCYLAHTELFRRAVPTYGIEPSFDLVAVRLEFKSTRPFYVRHALKRLQGVVFNAGAWAQEFYEENLCWIAPCYEIRYTLVRRSS